MRSIIAAEESLRRKATIQINVLARVMRNNFDRKVSVLHVTRSQWSMMAVVTRYPGSTQRIISEYLEISEASAGRLIDKLCTEGLLERRAHKEDRRARAVYPTRAADPLLAQLSHVASLSEAELFEGFSDAEMKQLLGLLDRIYENSVRHS
ncbi:MarR family transcriptional regulator [Novosphingobium sp. 1949]|uniref:MarR family transcriptional regulator n=1 Tax=Novosphingobium organovorum TaxID=2930092 RepID=A0ABT0B998_9SPHN|nr:MarR family transcriptional regulator [Novosphingobium organovorum]MCJ2181645.1 MarR family transcriptional regulator [Novosphingobium organovorum]